MYVIVIDNEKELLEIARRKGLKFLEIDKEDFDTPELSKVYNATYSNVNEFLIALGIMPAFAVFHYLKYILESPGECDSISITYLYLCTASAFNTHPEVVRLAINNAVRDVINNPDVSELYCKIFGDFNVSLTNTQFIRGCKIYLEKNNIL